MIVLAYLDGQRKAWIFVPLEQMIDLGGNSNSREEQEPGRGGQVVSSGCGETRDHHDQQEYGVAWRLELLLAMIMEGPGRPKGEKERVDDSVSSIAKPIDRSVLVLSFLTSETASDGGSAGPHSHGLSLASRRARYQISRH